MTRLPSILLLAGLAAIPFLGSAQAVCEGLCDLQDKAKACITRPPAEMPDCLGLRGSACISFHVGGFVLGPPHITDQRMQFATYGVDFMVRSHADTVEEVNPFVIRYGYGVFTIDLNSDARAC